MSPPDSNPLAREACAASLQSRKNRRHNARMEVRQAANTIPGVNFFVLPAAVAGGASLVSARMRDPRHSAASADG